MLEIIIDKMIATTSDKFDKIFPLAELIERDGKVAPKQYIGDGQYQNIDFDNFAGTAYFRKLGNVQMDKSSFEKRGSCKQFYDVTYNIRLIGCTRKKIIQKDDAYTGEALCLSIFQDVVQSNGDLCVLLKAANSEITLREYSDNTSEILEDEFKGLERKNIIPMDYVLVKLDFVVSATITAECVQYYCNSYCDYSARIGSGNQIICFPSRSRTAPFGIDAESGQNSYQDDRFKNQVINLILVNNTPLRSDQFSFDSATGTFEYLDQVPLVTGDKLYFTFA